MCRRIECSRCHKPTFSGCGMHIEQVLGDVPRDQRCSCGKGSKAEAPKGNEPSFFSRMFGSGGDPKGR